VTDADPHSPSPAAGSAPVPTFADHVPVVSGAVSDGTRRVYGTYWKRLLEHWPDRRIDEPTPSQIQQLSGRLRAQRTVRRNGRGGQLTGEHFIAALRCLYRHAIADGLVSDNPAARVEKPRRPRCARRSERSDWPRSTRLCPARATTRFWTPC
jgi:integrase/recombinase XerC